MSGRLVRCLGLLRTAPAVGILILCLGYAVYTLSAGMHAEAVIRAAGLEARAPGDRVDLDVELRVPPEDFHMIRLQDAGQLREVDGRVVRLARVHVGDARRLARALWIVSMTDATADR